MDKQIGAYSFVVGVIIAILGGAFSGFLPIEVAQVIPLVLVVLGLIVGLLNVTDKEIKGFLLAAIALMVVGGANLKAITFFDIGLILESIVLHVNAFVSPAALIVALKEVYNIAKNP